MSRASTRRLPRLAIAAAICLLLLLVAGVLALRQAGEWARAAVESRLQARLAPPLRISEPIEFALSPLPTATVRAVTLGGDTADADLRIDELRVGLEPEPLWRGELEVATIRVSGVELVLRSGSNGWNVANWLRPDAGTHEPGAPLPPIGRITVEDAQIRVEGGPAGKLADLRLVAGPFAPGRAGRVELSARALMQAPLAAALDLALAAGFEFADGSLRLDAPQLTAEGELTRWRVSRAEARAASARWSPTTGLALAGLALGLDAAAGDQSVALDATLGQFAGREGRWEGVSLTAALRAASGAAHWRAELSAAPRVEPEGWTLDRLELAAAGDEAAPAVALELAGTLAGDGPDAPLRLAVERGRVRLPHPAAQPEPLDVAFTGRAVLEPESRTARATLAGRFDASRFDGTAHFDPAAAPPLTLSLALDRLDLDRYLPPDGAERHPADLTAWRDWPVAAELTVGRLQIKGLASENARLRLEGGGELKGGR